MTSDLEFTRKGSKNRCIINPMYQNENPPLPAQIAQLLMELKGGLKKCWYIELMIHQFVLPFRVKSESGVKRYFSFEIFDLRLSFG